LSYTCDELGYVFYDDWDPEYYSDESEWTYDDEWSYDDEECAGVFIEEGDCMEMMEDEGVDI